MRNSTSTTIATSTATLPLNQWSRIEMAYVGGNATIRIFAGDAEAESTTQTETIGPTAVGGTAVGIVRIGQVTGATWEGYFDDERGSDADWIGPANPAPPTTYTHWIVTGAGTRTPANVKVI